MINSNILNILKSNLSDPSYSVIIKNFQQPTFCNKDQILLTVEQINPNLFKIIENQNTYIQLLENKLTENNISKPSFNRIGINNIVEKTLTIDSVLNFDKTSNMFTSGITGSLGHEIVQSTSTTQENTHQDITTQYIESFLCVIESSINLDFDYNYKTLPSVIITIDQDDKIYSSYNLKFTTNNNNEYTGVKITFKNLKRSKKERHINITIIGDEVA